MTMNETQIPLSESELIGFCHRAKERARSNLLEDRQYALIVLLRDEKLGSNDPGLLLSSNPSFKERCEEVLNDLFNNQFEANFRVIAILNEHLVDDASFTEQYKNHLIYVSPREGQWGYAIINPGSTEADSSHSSSYPDKRAAVEQAKLTIDRVIS